MIFTHAEAHEAKEIADLVNSAYRGDTSRQGWTTEADFLDGTRTNPGMLRLDMTPDQGKTILCMRELEEGPIVGCVYLEKFEDHKGTGCYLGMLTVSPTLQARGLGRVLMAKAESFAREAWNARRMTLGVIQLRDSLIEWYKRRGYFPNGETEPFPYGDLGCGLPKRDDLHFVMFEKQLE